MCVEGHPPSPAECGLKPSWACTLGGDSVHLTTVYRAPARCHVLACRVGVRLAGGDAAAGRARGVSAEEPCCLRAPPLVGALERGSLHRQRSSACLSALLGPTWLRG